MDKEQLKLLEKQLVRAHVDVSRRCDCSMLNIEISFGYAPVLQGDWAWTVQLSHTLVHARSKTAGRKRYWVGATSIELETAIDDAVRQWDAARSMHGSAFTPWVVPSKAVAS